MAKIDLQQLFIERAQLLPPIKQLLLFPPELTSTELQVLLTT